MAAPTIVGTPARQMYSTFNFTPGSGANFVLIAGKVLPAGTIRTVSGTYDGGAVSGGSARMFQWDDSVNPFHGIARLHHTTPGTGAKTIVLTPSGGQINMRMALSFSGVDTGNPFGTAVDNNGNSSAATATITGVPADSLAVAILALGANREITGEGGDTLYPTAPNIGTDNETLITVIKAGGGDVSFNLGWTGGATSWGITAFALNGTSSTPLFRPYFSHG